MAARAKKCGAVHPRHRKLKCDMEGTDHTYHRMYFPGSKGEAGDKYWEYKWSDDDTHWYRWVYTSEVSDGDWDYRTEIEEDEQPGSVFSYGMDEVTDLDLLADATMSEQATLPYLDERGNLVWPE